MESLNDTAFSSREELYFELVGYVKWVNNIYYEKENKMTTNKNNRNYNINLFIENTKLNPSSYINLHIDHSNDFLDKSEIYWLEEYDVKPDYGLLNDSLDRCISNRHSTVQFLYQDYIEKEYLYNLLYFTLSEQKNKKPVPSAGGKYSIDLYIFVFNVIDLENGIYKFNQDENQLMLLRKGDFREKLKKCLLPNEHIDRVSFLIVSVGNIDKTTYKYKDRGYKLLYLDCGHISQNFYLLSSSMGLGCRPWFGFFDDDFSDLLKLEENRKVLLTHFFGNEDNTANGYFYDGENISDFLK